jgi:hypothetical protein
MTQEVNTWGLMEFLKLKLLCNIAGLHSGRVEIFWDGAWPSIEKKYLFSLEGSKEIGMHDI